MNNISDGLSTPNHNVVLMTTPSLDPKINVSGISSVVRGLMFASRKPEYAFDWTIVPTVAGKRDRQRRGLVWLLSQIAVLKNIYSGIRQWRPAIIHVNGPLSRLAIVRDAAIIRLARIFAIPIVYHLHGGAYVHCLPESRLLRYVTVASLDLASVILVLSDLEAASISRNYNITPDRIRVLRNAVDVPDNCPLKETTGRLRVLSIGRLSPEKGLSVLCDAIEENSDLRERLEIRMYGAGDLTAEITTRLATSLGPAFRFEGIAGDEEKAKAYAWADVVVMPSLWGEGLPMVLLEAMAAGVVPVATPDGSIGEVLKDQRNGLMIEKDSQKSLATGLRCALELKRTGELKHLAQSAHRTVQEIHSLFTQGRSLSQIYAEITQ